MIQKKSIFCIFFIRNDDCFLTNAKNYHPWISPLWFINFIFPIGFIILLFNFLEFLDLTFIHILEHPSVIFTPIMDFVSPNFNFSVDFQGCYQLSIFHHAF